MTAVSAAARFAAKAELCEGWFVERCKHTPFRTVHATRGDEVFTFTWTYNDETGNFNLTRGVHRVLGITEEWDNLSAALREMETPPSVFALTDDGLGFTKLPFDPVTAGNDTALDALRGREITWRNRISGQLETATVPFNGRHTAIIDHFDFAPEDRAIVFASNESGFRAVRLGSLINVGSAINYERKVAA